MTYSSRITSKSHLFDPHQKTPEPATRGKPRALFQGSSSITTTNNSFALLADDSEEPVTRVFKTCFIGNSPPSHSAPPPPSPSISPKPLTFALSLFALLPIDHPVRELADCVEARALYSSDAQIFLEEQIKLLIDRLPVVARVQDDTLRSAECRTIREHIQERFNAHGSLGRKEATLLEEKVIRHICALLEEGECTALYCAMISKSATLSSHQVQDFACLTSQPHSDRELYQALFSTSPAYVLRTCLEGDDSPAKRLMLSALFASLHTRLQTGICTLDAIRGAFHETRRSLSFPGCPTLCSYQKKDRLQFLVDQFHLTIQNSSQGALKELLVEHLDNLSDLFVLREDHIFQPEISGSQVKGLHYLAPERWEELQQGPGREIHFGHGDSLLQVRVLYPLLRLSNGVQIGTYKALFTQQDHSTKTRCKISTFFPQEMTQQQIMRSIETAVRYPLNDYNNSWGASNPHTNIFSMVPVRLPGRAPFDLPLYLFLHRDLRPNSVTTIDTAFPVIADTRRFSEAPIRSLHTSDLIYAIKGEGLKSSPLKNKVNLTYSQSPTTKKMQKLMQETQVSLKKAHGQPPQSFMEHFLRAHSLQQSDYLPPAPGSNKLVLKTTVDKNWLGTIRNYIETHKENPAFLIEEADLQYALSHLSGFESFAVYSTVELAKASKRPLREGKENKETI